MCPSIHLLSQTFFLQIATSLYVRLGIRPITSIMASGQGLKSTKPPSLRSGRLGFNLCYQPANDSCFQAHGIDVVAIHDFSPHLSDGTASWVDDNGESWIQDFLPSEMPNARIWTFNYRSDENTELEPLAVGLIAGIKLEIGHTVRCQYSIGGLHANCEAK